MGIQILKLVKVKGEHMGAIGAQICKFCKPQMQTLQPNAPQCTLINRYIKTPNTNFVFLLQSMPYDVKIGPH